MASRLTRLKRRFNKSVGPDFATDLKAAKQLWLPWWLLLIICAGSIPVYWQFDQWGILDFAQPTLLAIFLFGFLLAVEWDLRKQAWFWITIGSFAAIHVPLVMYIPWPHNWVPAAVWTGWATLDFILLLALLSVVRRFVGRSREKADV